MPRTLPSVGQTQSRRPTRCPYGFTLIEILVVIVIVGVIITMTTISVGVLGRDREMQEQAEHIWAVLQQTKEECELQGFDVGLRVGLNSYDFLKLDRRQQVWLPVIDDDFLRARALPEGLRFRLWLEGREVVLKENLQSEDTTTESKQDSQQGAKQDKLDNKTEKSDLLSASADEKDKKKKELPPQIMVLSSGDLNSFDLQLEREGVTTRWHVASRPDNTVFAEQVNDES